MARLGKKLMVLSLADHAFDTKGDPVAYEPYVRELDLWCELFEEVDIYTNILDFDFKKHKYASFKYNNVKLRNLFSKPIDGSIKSKIIFICLLTIVSIQLLFVFWKYDLVHIRNSALLSAILGFYVRIFNKPSITKWAGSYSPYEGEPLVAKIDRKVVDIYNQKHKVLVYDNIYKKHFEKFIPALMSEAEIKRAEAISKNKNSLLNRLEIVAIGRLQYTKNFELIPPALALFKKQNPKIKWHFHLIGDGHLRKKIEDLIKENKIQDNVTLYGAKPFVEAQSILAKSHLLIMPGVKEGWPKPIAEAWAHNIYPIAANRGNLPDIIDSDNKGLLFEPTTLDLAKKIEASFKILIAKEKTLDLTSFANEMSLENFKSRLIDVIKKVL